MNSDWPFRYSIDPSSLCVRVEYSLFVYRVGNVCVGMRRRSIRDVLFDTAAEAILATLDKTIKDKNFII